MPTGPARKFCRNFFSGRALIDPIFNDPTDESNRDMKKCPQNNRSYFVILGVKFSLQLHHKICGRDRPALASIWTRELNNCEIPKMSFKN